MVWVQNIHTYMFEACKAVQTASPFCCNAVQSPPDVSAGAMHTCPPAYTYMPMLMHIYAHAHTPANVNASVHAHIPVYMHMLICVISITMIRPVQIPVFMFTRMPATGCISPMQYVSEGPQTGERSTHLSPRQDVSGGRKPPAPTREGIYRQDISKV